VKTSTLLYFKIFLLSGQYAIPDQKAVRIAKLLAQEIVSIFGVLEALLSDRGTNLLSRYLQAIGC